MVMSASVFMTQASQVTKEKRTRRFNHFYPVIQDENIHLLISEHTTSHSRFWAFREAI